MPLRLVDEYLDSSLPRAPLRSSTAVSKAFHLLTLETLSLEGSGQLRLMISRGALRSTGRGPVSWLSTLP